MINNNNTVELSILNSSENSFFRYLQEIKKFPLLTLEEEQYYSKRFVASGDKEAAKILVQSHLRLVVKIASKFRNYGLPIADLVSEGNIGLIQAVKKFDPDKGFRFATYAIWWIKAYMQEYILRSWSLVKIGTTTAQRKLFFNLGKIKKKIGIAMEAVLEPKQITAIAQDLGVEEREVIEMNSRMQNSDSSLNQTIGNENDGIEIIDNLISKHKNQEEIISDHQETSAREHLFKIAFNKLNEREKEIIKNRKLSENPLGLKELSKIFGVSSERIRQIEEAALNKIKKEIAALNNVYA